MKGFNEVYRVAKIHLDANFCLKAYANGYRLVDLGQPVYHLNHAGSYSNPGSGSGGTATASRNPVVGGVNNGVFQEGSTTLQGVTALPVPTETSPFEPTPISTTIVPPT